MRICSKNAWKCSTESISKVNLCFLESFWIRSCSYSCSRESWESLKSSIISFCNHFLNFLSLIDDVLSFVNYSYDLIVKGFSCFSISFPISIFIHECNGGFSIRVSSCACPARFVLWASLICSLRPISIILNEYCLLLLSHVIESRTFTPRYDLFCDCNLTRIDWLVKAC